MYYLFIKKGVIKNQYRISKVTGFLNNIHKHSIQKGWLGCALMPSVAFIGVPEAKCGNIPDNFREFLRNSDVSHLDFFTLSYFSLLVLLIRADSCY